MYCDERKITNLAVGKTTRLDTQVNRVRQIVVSVQSGVLDIYKGDNPSGTGNPTWRFRAGEPVSKVPLTWQGQVVLTGVALVDTVNATVVFEGE